MGLSRSTELTVIDRVKRRSTLLQASESIQDTNVLPVVSEEAV